MKSFLVDQDGYYGEFGGAYVPEILHKCVEELTNKYLEVIESEDFKKEFDQLLRDYVGRPSPLYLAKRLSEKYGCKLYLKREDLNHTGAHKINNTIGQILLARFSGSRNSAVICFSTMQISLSSSGELALSASSPSFSRQAKRASGGTALGSCAGN